MASTPFPRACKALPVKTALDPTAIPTSPGTWTSGWTVTRPRTARPAPPTVITFPLLTKEVPAATVPCAGECLDETRQHDGTVMARIGK
jgi:hypothetical protein